GQTAMDFLRRTRGSSSRGCATLGASADASQRTVRRARGPHRQVREFVPCGSSCFRNRCLSGTASGLLLAEDDYLANANGGLPVRLREQCHCCPAWRRLTRQGQPLSRKTRCYLPCLAAT